MVNEMFLLQEDICLLSENLLEIKRDLDNKQKRLNTLFEKTILFYNYKRLYDSVKLEYIDESIIILNCNNEIIELEIEPLLNKLELKKED